VYLATDTADMRKSIDTLAILVAKRLKQSPCPITCSTNLTNQTAVVVDFLLFILYS